MDRSFCLFLLRNRVHLDKWRKASTIFSAQIKPVVGPLQLEIAKALHLGKIWIDIYTAAALEAVN